MSQTAASAITQDTLSIWCFQMSGIYLLGYFRSLEWFDSTGDAACKSRSERSCHKAAVEILLLLGPNEGMTEFETHTRAVRNVLTLTTTVRHDGEHQRYKSGAQRFLWHIAGMWLKGEKKIKCLVVQCDQIKRFERGDRTWGWVGGTRGLSAQRVGAHAVTQGPPLRPQHQHLRLQGTKQGRHGQASICPIPHLGVLLSTFSLKQAKDDKMRSTLSLLFMIEGNFCQMLACIVCINDQTSHLRNCPIWSHLLMTGKLQVFTLVSRLKAVFLRSCNARCMNSNAWQSTHGRPGSETQRTNRN